MQLEHVEAIASDFLRILCDALTPVQFAELCARTASETHPDVCHSHDYLDANEVMAEAFHNVTNREVDTQDDADRQLWTSAWDTAKREMVALDRARNEIRNLDLNGFNTLEGNETLSELQQALALIKGDNSPV